MSLIRRLWRDISGNRVRTAMLAAVVIVVAVTLFIGQYIYTVAETYYRACADQAGNGIMVTSEEEVQDFESKLSAIEGMEHVAGSDQRISCSCLPVDFKNVPYEADGMYSSMEDTGEVRLQGDSHTGWYDTFRMGNMVLIEGSYPSEENRGAVIADALAEENRLAVGDRIIVRSNLTDQPEQLMITGIYRTVKAPKVEVNGYYLFASESYIFCDLASYSRVDSLNDAMSYAYIYADRYENVADLCRKIELLDSRLDTLDCLNSDLETDSPFPAVTVLRKLFSRILGIGLILYLGILYFMVQLWMRNQYGKIGIYLVLGKTKREIFAEIFMMLECILIPVIMLMGCILRIVLNRQGGGLIRQITGLTLTTFGNSSWEADAVQQASGWQQILSGCGMLLLIGSLPAVVSLVKAMRMHYKVLLEENNKM